MDCYSRCQAGCPVRLLVLVRVLVLVGTHVSGFALRELWDAHGD